MIFKSYLRLKAGLIALTTIFLISFCFLLFPSIALADNISGQILNNAAAANLSDNYYSTLLSTSGNSTPGSSLYGYVDPAIDIDESNEAELDYPISFNDDNQLATAVGYGSSESSISALADTSSTSLPTSYTTPNLLKIRNQNPYGTCWAFSTISAIELSALRHGIARGTIDLSELQLAYFVFNRKGIADPLDQITGDYNYASYDWLNCGGNAEIALWTLATWCGATDEEDAPYSSASSTGSLDSSLAFDQDSYHVIGAQRIPITKTDDIKQAIMENGGVSIAYCHDDDYYNSNNNCFYDPKNLSTNHLVTIVGWDDDFSKENFTHEVYAKDSSGNYIFEDGELKIDETATASTTPSSDGAWLIRNSWGSFGDENNICGYFWMSYENSSIYSYTYTYTVEPTSTHDNNYQWDGSAGSGSLYLLKGNSVASIYTAHGNADGYELLDSIGIGLTSTAVGYSVQVYKNLTDMTDPTSGTAQLDAPVTGTTGYSGYVSIPLGQDIELNEGDTFSIVFTCKTTSANVSVEGASWSSYASYVADIQEGQSFIKSSGTWTDLASYQRNYPYTARLKAYTKNVDSNPYADLEPVTLVGHSMLLDGSIGSNMLLAIPDEVMAIDGAYAQVTSPDGTTLCRVSLADALSRGAYKGVTTYTFDTYVSSLFMADECTLHIYAPDGTPLNFESADGENYTESGYESSLSDLYESTVTSIGSESLAASMLFYGARCQTYFEHNTSRLATAPLSDARLASLEAEANGLNQDKLSSYIPSSINTDAVSCAGANVSFGSNLKLIGYFKLDEGTVDDYFYYIDGQQVSPVIVEPYWSDDADKSETYVSLTTDGIRAGSYDISHTFTLVRADDGSEACQLSMSCYGYMWVCLANDFCNQAYLDLCRAMYVYDNYAKQYV